MLGGTSDAWHDRVALSVDVRLPGKATPSFSDDGGVDGVGGGTGATTSYGGGCLHVVNGGGPLSLAPSFRGHCVHLNRDETTGALSWSLVSGTSDTLASGPVSGAVEGTERKEEVGESRWYRLRLSYVQPTMSVWVDGVVVREMEVLKNVTKGRVALCSGWNAADFDNFKITSTVGAVV